MNIHRTFENCRNFGCPKEVEKNELSSITLTILKISDMTP